MALGVPGRLRPWIISTFSTTRVVGHQPNAPATFTPGEIPGTHFQRLSQPQGTWFCRQEPWKKSPLTPPGIDPRTVRLPAQCLLLLLSVGLPVANAPDVLQPCGLLYYPSCSNSHHKSSPQEILAVRGEAKPYYF